MKIINADKIPAQAVEIEGAKEVTIRWVIGSKDGAPNFYMRVFEAQPGGYTPLHTHEWEHEIYIIEGEAVAVSEDGEHNLNAGDAVFVPGNDLHQFKNNSGSVMKFICLIPSSGKCFEKIVSTQHKMNYT